MWIRDAGGGTDAIGDDADVALVIRCVDATVPTTSVSTLPCPVDGGSWEWSEDVWTWPRTGDLQLLGEDSGEVDPQEQAAPYFDLDCADVKDPTNVGA